MTVIKHKPTKIYMHYFSTVDFAGEPNSFWCPKCRDEVLEGAKILNQTIETIEVRADHSPIYRCQICGIDYRDFFGPNETSPVPPSGSHPKHV